MTTYVLVGGAWLGGWCWQKVARRLRDEGHDAYPVTLTGLGERAHLASPEVDLDTHISDVVNLIEYGGSSSCPRGTRPCSPGPRTSPGCSSISS